MTEVIKPWWYRFSEHAFSFNFITFSFVMFSCWFPTGFSATFSTLAFLFALPLLYFRIEKVNISLFEKVGLLLFSWLLLSVFWSQTGILNGLSYLSEYRLYFMVPVFATALLFLPNTQKWAFYAAVFGAVIALITSYGLGFGWWKIDGANLSLANRIYHGFIMSALLAVALMVARDGSGGLRICGMLLAVATVYNVIGIEVGRTGYIQVFVVSIVFILLSFSRVRVEIVGLLAVLILGAFYLALPQLGARLDLSVHNLERAMVFGDFNSSVGYRLDFYQAALFLGAEHPLMGVGVGDVASELEGLFNLGRLQTLTDNVHSEFLNMLVAGGLPAMLLFLVFVFSIAWVGLKHRQADRTLGDTLVLMSALLITASLFNSTIKDYGEKHVLIIILSCLSANLATNLAGCFNSINVQSLDDRIP